MDWKILEIRVINAMRLLYLIKYFKKKSIVINSLTVFCYKLFLIFNIIPMLRIFKDENNKQLKHGFEIKVNCNKKLKINLGYLL